MNEKLSTSLTILSSIITISNYSDLLNLKDKNILIFEEHYIIMKTFSSITHLMKKLLND